MNERDKYSFTCPACGQRIVSDPKFIGLRIPCPHCDAVLKAPPPLRESAGPQAGAVSSGATTSDGSKAPAVMTPPPPRRTGPDTPSSGPIRPPPGPEKQPLDPRTKAAIIGGASLLGILFLIILLLLLFSGGGGGGEGGLAGPHDGVADATNAGEGGDGTGSGGPGGGSGGDDGAASPDRDETPSPDEGQAKAGASPVQAQTSQPQEFVVITKMKESVTDDEGAGGRRDPGRVGGGGGGGGGGRPLGTGDISFRIYWSPPRQDVDLHVIDPNGHHLWYREKHCACHCELDRDDTKSGGPENIYWPTGKGPHGTYKYYALYYSGSGRKKVTLQVRKEGKIIRKHTFVLKKVKDKSQTFTYEH